MTGSCCRGVGWNVIISFTLAAPSPCCCVCGIEPKWPPSLRQPKRLVSFTPVRRCVVGDVWVEQSESCCHEVDWSGSCCRGVDLDFSVSFTLVRQANSGYCVYDFEPTWPPSLRQSMGVSLSHWSFDGSSALCCESSLSRVVVMLIGAGRVVAVSIGTSSSLSLWLVSRGCCVCDIDPKWNPSLRHSKSWSTWHWLEVGLSALCCVRCLGRVCCRVVDFVLSGMAGWHCRGVDRNRSCCRDAEWHIPIYRLVHSAPSSGRCQIACNLARANLIRFIFFATMTA